MEKEIDAPGQQQRHAHQRHTQQRWCRTGALAQTLLFVRGQWRGVASAGGRLLRKTGLPEPSTTPPSATGVPIRRAISFAISA